MNRDREGLSMRLTYWQRAPLSTLTAVVVLIVFQLVAFGNLSVTDWFTSFAAILVAVGTAFFLLRRRTQ